MFLAFKLSDIITVSFGYLLSWMYNLTGNYGIALILFSIIVQLVLLPITAKSKKSMMKMSRLTPRMQEIQKRYAGDQAKQNQATQELYKEEGVSMFGGCLWGFVPMLILLPLYAVVRQPITYILHQSAEVSEQIVAIIQGANPDLFSSNPYYHQIVAAQAIPDYINELTAAIPSLSAEALAGVNFSFLGINLGGVPQFNVFKWSAWDWAHIGVFLVPCLSAGSQVLQMLISQKMNNSVITDDKGVQDEEAAKNSQAAQTNKTMMITMPLISLWIGFTVPTALSLYWFIGGVIRTVEDAILTKHYRKIYDAEDAIRLRKAMEQEAIEAEKERVRAERRAANPDGITSNTSKKKLQKAQQEREAAEKAAAAKEYAARKGLSVEEDNEQSKAMSGIPDRPFCKGRAYEPDRYSGHTEE